MNKPFAHTCPWWLLPAFDNPLRKWVHDPARILTPYVHPGDTVLDVGCGMGYFTLTLARLVGKDGSVIAADLQTQMLNGLRKRATRAGLLDQMLCQVSTPDRIGLNRPIDFALAFWMVHEVRRPDAFLQEIHDALRPGGRLLIVEPIIHVTGTAYNRTLRLAEQLGFTLQDAPSVTFSRAGLLQKAGGRG